MPKNFIKIAYADAHYAYTKNIKVPEGKIISCGKIRNLTDRYIDLELAWSENPHQTIFGIVIPRNATNKNLSEKIEKDRYTEDDVVAVYWDDIFVYNEKYTGKCKPVSMVTEGTLLKETTTYVLIDDPETLNLDQTINHPPKKPRRYYIPKSMIREIRRIKNDSIK